MSQKISTKTGNLFRENKKTFLVIFIALFLLGLILLILPLTPHLKSFKSNNNNFTYQTRLENQDLFLENIKDVPSDNRIVIPKISVDEEILEGENKSTLLEGVWRLPDSSIPSKASNTVITGHRYLTPSNKPFYHFDKLAPGDQIIIYWEEREFDYEIKSIYETNPLDPDVTQKTTYPKLTLFTCTSLFLQNKRLVVEAELIYPDIKTLEKFSKGYHQEVINELYSYKVLNGKIKVVIKGQPIEIKKEPLSDSETIFTIESEKEMEVVGENDGWFKIILDNQDLGWIPKNTSQLIE